MSRQVLTYPDLPPLLYLPLTGGTLSGNLGIGVTPAAWDSLTKGVQVGTGALIGVPTQNQVQLLNNLYFNGTANVPIQASQLSHRLRMDQLGFTVENGQAGALGVAVTLAERFKVVANGTAYFNSDTGGHVIAQRGSPTTQSQYFRFAGGVGYDAAFYRVANNDNAHIGFTNDGTNWNHIFKFLPSGQFYVGDETGGGNPAQQRYIRIAWNSASGNSPPAATCAIEMATPNPGYVGIDLHVPNVAKYGMLYANNSEVCLGRDIGWGKPTVTMHGAQIVMYPSTSGSSLWIQQGQSTATNLRIATGQGNMELASANGYITPSIDNFMYFGAGNLRWVQIAAVSGTINTCSREVKEIVGTVNDTVALEQLMSLPAIYRFHYKHYVPVEGATPETPPEEAYRLEVDTTQEFLGPVAEEMPMDMKVGELTGGNVNTEGHLMASLRGAVKEYRFRLDQLMMRIAALEGRMPV